jgi:steroid delta-isomerase-like uncharacterized protein
METIRLEANKALIRAFNDAVDRRDYEALDKLLTEDFHRHSAASPEANATNRDEMKLFLQATEGTFPDVQNIVKMMVAEGDMVAVYATFTGTMDGPMGDIPPTGNRVEAPFISFFRIEDGNIAEMWVEWDNVNFLSQLGLFPPPGTGE